MQRCGFAHIVTTGRQRWSPFP